jgi:hypothetical protein
LKNGGSENGSKQVAVKRVVKQKQKSKSRFWKQEVVQEARELCQLATKSFIKYLTTTVTFLAHKQEKSRTQDLIFPINKKK